MDWNLGLWRRLNVEVMKFAFSQGHVVTGQGGIGLS